MRDAKQPKTVVIIRIKVYTFNLSILTSTPLITNIIRIWNSSSQEIGLYVILHHTLTETVHRPPGGANLYPYNTLQSTFYRYWRQNKLFISVKIANITHYQTWITITGCFDLRRIQLAYISKM